MENQEKICRICLNSGSYQQLTQIYSNNNEIALKINLISGISVGFKIVLQTSSFIRFFFQIIELTEYNIPALICQNCLKELYQCISFRRKCHVAEEFFRTRTSGIETQLWKVDEEETTESQDYDSVKVELFEKTLDGEVDDENIQESFDFLPDDLDIKTTVETINEKFHSDEEFIDAKVSTKNMGFRRRPKKTSGDPVKTKTSRSSLECKYCGIILSRRNRLIQHERLHVIDQTQDFYLCFFCGKSFNQKFGNWNIENVEKILELKFQA